MTLDTPYASIRRAVLSVFTDAFTTGPVGVELLLETGDHRRQFDFTRPADEADIAGRHQGASAWPAWAAGRVPHEEWLAPMMLGTASTSVGGAGSEIA
ncbi:hypothetical protein [Nonomuraea roseola]|uniref:Uncharacterized protein n=1 Tax=Nonomuraea roseola TaxID=46179 RepID=A0ABV5PRZ0_9ACTN